MSKQKSLYTVKQATALAFDSQPERFHAINLVQMARALMARPMCFDGTILRRLRELRDENPTRYGYRVTDPDAGKYEKKEFKPVNQTQCTI